MRIEYKGFIAEMLDTTGTNKNKWVMRIAPREESERSLYQWDLNKRSQGYGPRVFKNGKEYDESIVKECFEKLYLEKVTKRVIEDDSSPSSSIIEEKEHKSMTNKMDILLEVAKASNGDADILNRVLDMLEVEQQYKKPKEDSSEHIVINETVIIEEDEEPITPRIRVLR